MKRFMIILTISLSILISSTLAKAADVPKVLLILPDALPQFLDNMLNKEVNVMKSMLEKANFKVVVATTNGLPIKGSTVTLTPDLKLSDVKGNDYVGIIIACMGSGEYTPVSPIAVLIVKQAITQGKPVAASHSSVNTLAEAGVLAGKRYAFRTDPLGIGRRPDDRFTGAIYGGTGVVQDGNIITCGACPETAASHGLPDGTVELTQAFITALTTKK
jgi:putative intracellular protease/amidase